MSLIVGVGASRGVTIAEVGALIDRLWLEHGLDPSRLTAFATIDLKAAEPGLVAIAGAYHCQLLTYPARVLATVTVPNPSTVVRERTGTSSVAEAAALYCAAQLGENARLVVPKLKSPAATCAVAEHR
ncbi:hypothetical protein D5S17_01220 [Pseudonocardiaceae bacterium YIM PH 21723]|nr:hypothetical protein D5S17_01220 [Pseudonocardiaceae bacterium YIM PH 21723]